MTELTVHVARTAGGIIRIARLQTRFRKRQQILRALEDELVALHEVLLVRGVQMTDQLTHRVEAALATIEAIEDEESRERGVTK